MSRDQRRSGAQKPEKRECGRAVHAANLAALRRSVAVVDRAA